ncbi:uncharacterized protein BO66DRAFT_169939 [Aspergillus aculeatinus CBS 121060]|uniref:Uncharacterized protein n=1 Tax=Aspergillus aculeatinus CBS 121060 TaxID=1448322 RepID=A0ACD1GZH3_9EURO|nr:hypothetical protein BO66DRAFT_169939 [Aspergillus aculeatinus CBS 121060]RAH66698.1 hypothetical protein BO66DRAFT_169939 [Aspergillus aculeatinus CBS 121060]
MTWHAKSSVAFGYPCPFCGRVTSDFTTSTLERPRIRWLHTNTHLQAVTSSARIDASVFGKGSGGINTGVTSLMVDGPLVPRDPRSTWSCIWGTAALNHKHTETDYNPQFTRPRKYQRWRQGMYRREATRFITSLYME